MTKPKLLFVSVLAASAGVAGCTALPDMAPMTDGAQPAAQAVARRAAPSRGPSDDDGSARSQERQDRNKTLAAAWNSCKTRFAADLAQRTSRPSEAILDLAFTACSREEDALKTSFAEGRMRPEAINDTIARIRQTSRDELLLRILAIRAEKKVTAN